MTTAREALQQEAAPPRYTLAPGRSIARDGVPIARVTRFPLGGTRKGHALTSTKADEFARLVVEALNAYDRQGAAP
jgi:hypothetical protein